MRVLASSLAAAAMMAMSGCGGSTPSASPIPSTLASAETSVPPALALYHLTGDLATSTFELSPLRGGQALGDTYDVDLSPYRRALRLARVSVPAPNDVRLGFEFTHPLPDTTKRKDLHVFDLRLHFLNAGVSKTFNGAQGLEAPLGVLATTEPIVTAAVPLLNAQGWSTWGDEVVEPVIGDLVPNCYPFLRIHEDPTQTTFNANSPSGWNVVPMGPAVYGFEAQLAVGTGQSISMILAMDASFGSSALKTIADPAYGSFLNPAYLNPEFNLKEVWKGEVEVSGTPKAADGSTLATVALTAYDHQGEYPRTGNGVFDPLTAAPTSLRYEGGLKRAVVSIPGTMPIARAVTVFTGNGTPASPYTASIDLVGNEFTTGGTFFGMVGFEDEIKDVIGIINPRPTEGFTAAGAPVKRWDFTTYIPFVITVTPPDSPAPTWTVIHGMIANGDPNTPDVKACIECHGTTAGDLTMTADKAATYAVLVNVPSSCALDYIEPGNPASSFLYKKITETPPACGDQMPQEGPKWSQTAKDLVRDWIQAGAPNN